MDNKKQSRIRRARRSRAKIRELGAHRLCIYRSPRHIYAQLIAPNGSEVVASASTLDKEIRQQLTGATGNIAAAQVVGAAVAKRAAKAGITKIAFDRSGYRYHGRIKALADAARENGLQF